MAFWVILFTDIAEKYCQRPSENTMHLSQSEKCLW